MTYRGPTIRIATHLPFYEFFPKFVCKTHICRAVTRLGVRLLFARSIQGIYETNL